MHVRKFPPLTAFARRRILLVLAVLVLVSSACGVSRTVEDFDAGATTLPEPGATTSSAPPTTTPPSTVPPTTTPFVAPETAATVTFADGSTSVITGDEVEAAFAQVFESEPFRTLAFPQGVPAEFRSEILSLMVREDALDVLIADNDIDVAGDRVASIEEELLTSLEQGFAQQGDVDPRATAEQVQQDIPVYFGLFLNSNARQQSLIDFLPAQTLTAVCSRHILLASEEEAIAAIDRIAAGEEFEALAAELSTGPSGPDGGDLGCSDPGGFVPEFAAAITDAPIGEVIGPVQTDFGFHVIRVDGTEEGGIRDPAAVFQETLTEVFDATTVEISPEYGVWDNLSLQVQPA